MEQRVAGAISKSLVEFGYPDCTPAVVLEIKTLIEGGKNPDDLGYWLDETNYGVLVAFVWQQLKTAYERRLIPKNDYVSNLLKEGE